MLVITRASLRAGTMALALATALGCDDERRPPKRPGQHWSHPVGNHPQHTPQRQGPHERHFKKGHDRSTPPIVRSEGEIESAAPLDAGAKPNALAPDAGDEVFLP